MMKDLTPDQQLTIITKLFERFEFNYDALKYKAWRADNSPLFWVTCLAQSTSETLKSATIKCFEVDYIYEIPTATQFAKLCGIEPITTPKPVEEHVDTETGEITPPEPAKQAGDMPQGPRWAQKHYASMQRGVKLPPDTVRMVKFALQLRDD